MVCLNNTCFENYDHRSRWSGFGCQKNSCKYLWVSLNYNWFMMPQKWMDISLGVLKNIHLCVTQTGRQPYWL